MTGPDWLLVGLALLALAIGLALLDQWLGLVLIVGLLAGYLLGLWV